MDHRPGDPISTGLARPDRLIRLSTRRAESLTADSQLSTQTSLNIFYEETRFEKSRLRCGVCHRAAKFSGRGSGDGRQGRRAAAPGSAVRTIPERREGLPLALPPRL